MKKTHVLWVMVLFLGACSSAWGPEITIQWRTPKPQLQQGTPLIYLSVKVGEVKKLQVGPGGEQLVQARILKQYAHYVKAESTFLVRQDSTAQGAFIEVKPLKKDTAPARDGAVFAGSESEVEAGLKGLITDWKKTSILAGAAVVIVLLLIFLVRMFFKLWAWLACLAGGAAAAYFLSGQVAALISVYLPENVRSDLIAYVLAFLAGFLLVSILLRILLSPLRKKR